MFGSAYIERLTREAAEVHATRAAAQAKQKAEATPPPVKPLHERIAEWYNGLSPAERAEVYSMDELAGRFPTHRGYLGVALHKLGWRRGRRYDADGPHRRFWRPPASQNEPGTIFDRS